MLPLTGSGSTDAGIAPIQTGGCSGNLSAAEQQVARVKRRSGPGGDAQMRAKSPRTPPHEHEESVSATGGVASFGARLGCCQFVFGPGSAVTTGCTEPPLEALWVDGVIDGVQQSGRVYCRAHAVELVEAEMRERRGCVTVHSLTVDRLYWRQHWDRVRQDQVEQLRRDVEENSYEAIRKSAQAMYLWESGKELQRAMNAREHNIRQMCERFAVYKQEVQEAEVGVYDRVIQMEARAEGEHGKILSEAASEIGYLRNSLRFAESRTDTVREEGSRECDFLRRAGLEMEERLGLGRAELQEFRNQEARLRQRLEEQVAESRQAELAHQEDVLRIEERAAAISGSLRTELREVKGRLADAGKERTAAAVRISDSGRASGSADRISDVDPEEFSEPAQPAGRPEASRVSRN